MTPKNPAAGFPRAGRVSPPVGEAGPFVAPVADGPAGNTQDRGLLVPDDRCSPPGPAPAGGPGNPSPLPPPAVVAGAAVPGARASHRRVPAPGRGRTETPAGSAPDADDALSAGSTLRTFTIALPAGLKLLSLNGREHWAEKGRRHKALKNAAWAMARQAQIPRLERVSVVVEYQPRDRRERDPDNISPSGKAALDGLVAAKILADDSKTYVTGVRGVIGEPYPGGRLVLHLTEVPAATGSDAA